MLTGCFPFRRQEDEGLEVQAVLQKMLPRILKADYQRPEVAPSEVAVPADLMLLQTHCCKRHKVLRACSIC